MGIKIIATAAGRRVSVGWRSTPLPLRLPHLRQPCRLTSAKTSGVDTMICLRHLVPAYSAWHSACAPSARCISKKCPPHLSLFGFPAFALRAAPPAYLGPSWVIESSNTKARLLYHRLGFPFRLPGFVGILLSTSTSPTTGLL